MDLNDLTQRDMEDIAYDVEEISIFFKSRLRFWINERPDLTPVTVGKGLGGFSWTFFQRGADCNMCGNCCKSTFRRIWFWWGDEPHPEGVFSAWLGIHQIDSFDDNMSLLPIWIHINSEANGEKRCDFLVDAVEDGTGRQLGLCGLHEAGLKPNHCRQHPMSSVHNVHLKQGVVPLISRRLPSRNWRWPKCPIDVNSVPMSIGQYQTDKMMLLTWKLALGEVPNCKINEAYEEWRSLSHQTEPVQSNVFFESL